MTERLLRIVTIVPLLILGVTGALKLLGTLHAVPLWNTVDPIFQVSRRWVFAGAGAFELAFLVLAVKERTPEGRIVLIFTPLVAFILYRLGLAALGVRDPCPCLGGAESWWPWLEKRSDEVSALLLGLYAGATTLGAALTFLPVRKPKTQTQT